MAEIKPNITITFEPEAAALIERFEAAVEKLMAHGIQIPVSLVQDAMVAPAQEPRTNPAPAPADFVAVPGQDDELPFDTEPAPDPAPEITLAELRRRVVALAAAGKKDEVRDVVKAHAESVTKIPAEKYADVWAALDALEG